MWVRFPPGTVSVTFREGDSRSPLQGFVYVARLPSAPFPPGTVCLIWRAVAAKQSGLFPAVAVSVAGERGREVRSKIDVLCDVFDVGVHQRFLVMLLRDEHVERWDDEECEDRPNRHSADEHETD